MTQTQVLASAIADLLAPIVRRAVHPETTFLYGGSDIPAHAWHKKRGTYNGHETARPLAPRERLCTRLALLYALKECEKQLTVDMLADTEAIEDAKKHKAAGL